MHGDCRAPWPPDGHVKKEMMGGAGRLSRDAMGTPDMPGLTIMKASDQRALTRVFASCNFRQAIAAARTASQTSAASCSDNCEN